MSTLCWQRKGASNCWGFVGGGVVVKTYQLFFDGQLLLSNGLYKWIQMVYIFN